MRVILTCVELGAKVNRKRCKKLYQIIKNTFKERRKRRRRRRSVTRRKSPNVCKSCPKMISLEKRYILTTLQKCLRMWEIWANLLLPKALKSCPKSKKSPNLVTLEKGNPRCCWIASRFFLQKIGLNDAPENVPQISVLLFLFNFNFFIGHRPDPFSFNRVLFEHF